MTLSLLYDALKRHIESPAPCSGEYAVFDTSGNVCLYAPDGRKWTNRVPNEDSTQDVVLPVDCAHARCSEWIRYAQSLLYTAARTVYDIEDGGPRSV